MVPSGVAGSTTYPLFRLHFYVYSIPSIAEGLGGDSTFRGRVPGAIAWSSGNRGSAPETGGDGKGHLPKNFDELSPGGIRAESRYVFPDGSVRRRLDTNGGDGDTRQGSAGCGGRGAKYPGVPMALVGTSRIGSADLSTAVGMNALGGGGGDDITENSGRLRHIESREIRQGAYRGPGAAPGAGWAPGGRPPRAYIPFLNLPAFASKPSSGDVRRRHIRQGSADGSDSSPLPPPYDGPGRQCRGRPLVGVGGVPVSPGQAMLTGPGRPGTGTSGSSSRMFGDSESEDIRRRRRRHRRARGGSGSNPATDGDLSDGGDSVGSGSTDVDFLRRRAEAKLRSLERHEAAELVAGAWVGVGWCNASAEVCWAAVMKPSAVGDHPYTIGKTGYHQQCR